MRRRFTLTYSFFNDNILFVYLGERNTLGDDRIYIPENNAKYRHFQELSNNIKNCETESTLVVDHIACTVLLASDSVEHGG